jgi:chromosomal replication initiator protein
VDVAVDGSNEQESEQQVNESDHLWTAASKLLKAQVSEVVWLSTFQNIHQLGLADGELRLGVPSAQVRERVDALYLPLVAEALGDLGFPDLQVTLEVQQDRGAALFDDVVVEVMEPERLATNGVGGASAASPGGLNVRYSFETFVKGASNQFALAAALRVAETPARSYNPLFIYGAAGLGKTHLLHAIGHYVHDNYAHYSVKYVSTEAFLNEFVDSIRRNTQAQFKRRYRDVDVLLVDDIQFMEGKEGLQEEFFHTFNSLHGANKQIVISSDRMPDAIPTLEDRLRGRFKWGLITDIQPPDLETRLAILRNKAERDRSPVPDDVLEFIASRITNNIRELEGALIRVSAYASLNGVLVTPEMAERLLADLLSDDGPRPLTPDDMLTVISEFFGFSVESLKGKSRQRPLVTARQIGMYVMRMNTDLSYPAIAREFGGRDHTTVIHACDKIGHLIKERHQVYDQVTELNSRLKAKP